MTAIMLVLRKWLQSRARNFDKYEVAGKIILMDITVCRMHHGGGKSEAMRPLSRLTWDGTRPPTLKGDRHARSSHFRYRRGCNPNRRAARGQGECSAGSRSSSGAGSRARARPRNRAWEDAVRCGHDACARAGARLDERGATRAG